MCSLKQCLYYLSVKSSYNTHPCVFMDACLNCLNYEVVPFMAQNSMAVHLVLILCGESSGPTLRETLSERNCVLEHWTLSQVRYRYIS